MPSDGPMIGVNLQVVPDGLRLSKDRPFARLSLSVTPVIDDRPTSLKVDIRKWPSEIRALAKSFGVAIGRVAQAASKYTVVDARRLQGNYPVRAQDLTYADEADRLWQRIFAPDGNLDAGFAALLAALRQGMGDNQSSPPAGANWRYNSYDVCGLAAVLDALHLNVTAMSILMNAPVVADAMTQGTSRRPLDAANPNAQFWRQLSSEWLNVRSVDEAAGLLSNIAGGGAFSTRIGSDADREQVLSEMTLDAEALAGRYNGDRSRESVAGSALEGLANTLVNNVGSLFSLSSMTDANGSANAAWGIAPSQTRALSRELIRFSEAWNLGWEPVKQDPATAMKAEQDELDEEAPRRKYGAVQSYPTLAKFLSMIVDLEIPLEDILNASHAGDDGIRSYGAVAVIAGESQANAALPPPEQMLWTAYVHRKGSAALPPYFGPCLEHEAAARVPDEGAAIKEGVLNLSVERPTGGPRFQLNSFDVTGQLHGLLATRQEVARREQAGLGPGLIDTALTDLRSRGIELIDKDAKEEHIRLAQKDRVRFVANGNAADVRLDDAKSLMLGFRIDVALCDRGGRWRDPSRWRTLMAKDLRFRATLQNGSLEYRDIPEEYLRSVEIDLARARDEGHTRLMVGTTTVQKEEASDPVEIPPDPPSPPAEIKTETVAHEQVFAWHGQSLAVVAPSEEAPRTPADAIDNRIVVPVPSQDLAVDLEFDTPAEARHGETDRRPAPLREGRSYMFGARLCLVNGCGLRFEEARSRYVNPEEELVLGQSPTTPFLYLRSERIQAPDVMLPWNSVIVRRPPEEWPGETIDVMVVRSGSKSTRSSERVLIPPRVPFDLAEQGGVFDAARTDNRPAGAFSHNGFAALLDPETGTFPVARKGKWEFPAIQDPSDTSPVTQRPTETSRGSVFVLAAPKRRPKAEFYPDPMARRIIAKFCRVEDGLSFPAPGFGSESRAVEFWAAGKESRDAAPILLTLRRGSVGDLAKLGGWFDDSEKRVRLERYDEDSSATLNRLSVVLRPAEVVDLEIWSVADGGRLLDSHKVCAQFRKILAGFQASQSRLMEQGLGNAVFPQDAIRAINTTFDALTGRDAAIAMDDAQSRYRVNGLQSVKRVRLIHAVDKPLSAPAFVWRTPGNLGSLQLHPVTIVVAGENASMAGSRRSWSRYVEDHAHLPQQSWPSAPGGTTTFFVGHLNAHRKSTGKLRCEARWREFGAESEHFNAKQGRWFHDPYHQYARLFQIEAIAPDFQPADDIDLLHEDGEARSVRALSHAFVNGKARQLTLMLAATSRFTSFFPGGDSGGKDFERTSPDFDKSKASIWIDATIRPAPPAVDRVVPVFNWKTTSTSRRKKFTFVRETLLRVYLKRPWHSSGQGEMLALIGWPSNLADSGGQPLGDICGLDATGRMRSFITRWGADPIRISGQLTDLVSANDIGNYQTTRSDLLLTLAPDPADAGEADDPSPASARVSVFAYQPALDPKEGLWTADLRIDHGPSYFPFVQLGLARYQEHAVKDMELSSPTAHVVQIPPRREGSVIFESDRNLLLEVHGVGYIRSRTTSELPPDHEVNVPLLNVRLLYAADEDNIPSGLKDIRWRRVIDGAGNPIEQLRVKPIHRDGEVWWIVKMRLPASRWWKPFGLYLEEVELMEADQYGVSGTPSEFDAKLVERGPMFSHIIDLRLPS